MDIEKISDNQIRCTLNREDLNTRELNLSELAYGSEKARSLFQEMIQTAYEQCGFEVNDMPLMVEAIPLAGEKIILIITKIDDPDELDSRFSKFSPRRLLLTARAVSEDQTKKRRREQTTYWIFSTCFWKTGKTSRAKRKPVPRLCRNMICCSRNPLRTA